MRRAFLFALGLIACGGSTSTPKPAVRGSTGQVEAPLRPEPDLPTPTVVAVPEAPDVEPLALPGQTVPQVPAVLEPPPRDVVLLFATTAEVRLGEITVETGSVPTPEALTPIVEGLEQTEGMVVVVVDAAVSAVTVRRLVGLLPPERERSLLARGADGAEGLLPLSAEASAEAAEVTIAPDGFRVAERKGAPQLHLQPPEGGDPFDYGALRNKAKAFRTKHPDVESVRVAAASEVSAEVLLRALSQIRGPKCTPEPERCWLPVLAFGEGIGTTVASARPATELPEEAPKDGPPATVSLGRAEVPDTLDAAEVRKILERRIGYARMCYRAALADDAGLKGKVLLRLTIDANGEVEEVGVPSASLESSAVQDCLVRGVKGLRFTPPTRAPATVDVPLTFTLTTAAAK